MMAFTKRIKAINNRIKQRKPQYDLDRETTKRILVLLSKNINKYELITCKEVLPEKKLFRKNCYNQNI